MKENWKKKNKHRDHVSKLKKELWRRKIQYRYRDHYKILDPEGKKGEKRRKLGKKWWKFVLKKPLQNHTLGI